jgi:Flp pilus assembly protein TadG
VTGKAEGFTLVHRTDRDASGNGQTMVEFALIAPLALMLICGVMDYGRLFFTQASLEDAVQEAGRYASTGNSLSGLTRLQSIEAVLQQAAVGLNIQNIQISSFTNGTWVSGSAGGPGDTVAITVTMGMKLLTPMIGMYFPNGTYTFTASTTFQNEPFPVS